MHVQHVRPNRGPTKMGPPHEDQKISCLVLSCPWKLNDNTKLLPPDAFSVDGSKMRLRSGLFPKPRWGSLQRSPRPPSSLLLPKSRILSIVNEMTTLCVSVKAVGRRSYTGNGR